MAFFGYVALEGTLTGIKITADAGGAPLNADSLPTYRIYKDQTEKVMPNGTGTVAFLHTGTVTGATNASPIVITSASHELTDGARVTITGVLGNTAANGTFTITRVDANSVSLGS